MATNNILSVLNDTGDYAVFFEQVIDLLSKIGLSEKKSKKLIAAHIAGNNNEIAKIEAEVFTFISENEYRKIEKNLFSYCKQFKERKKIESIENNLNICLDNIIINGIGKLSKEDITILAQSAYPQSNIYIKDYLDMLNDGLDKKIILKYICEMIEERYSLYMPYLTEKMQKSILNKIM